MGFICFLFNFVLTLLLLQTIWYCNLSLVAFKLSKRKPDDNLQILHTLLYGKKSKVTFFLGAFRTSSFLLSRVGFESFDNVLSSQFLQIVSVLCVTYCLENISSPWASWRCWIVIFPGRHTVWRRILDSFLDICGLKMRYFIQYLLMLFCLVISLFFIHHMLSFQIFWPHAFISQLQWKLDTAFVM